MVINSIKVQNEGYIFCKSNFYSALDGLSSDSGYTFFTGVNKLIGEIDSGIWAVSYLLSMYKYRPEDFILFGKPKVIINSKILSLSELSEFSCYMDKIYPLFSTDNSVKELVAQGLDDSKLNYSPNDIKDLFHMDSERFERPLAGVGNEIFRAMAAIGYCRKKELFCFPWLSNMRFENYHGHLIDLLDILEHLKKTVILPIGATMVDTSSDRR